MGAVPRKVIDMDVDQVFLDDYSLALLAMLLVVGVEDALGRDVIAVALHEPTTLGVIVHIREDEDLCTTLLKGGNHRPKDRGVL